MANYERFLARSFKHPDAPIAMLEVADCYRRVGRLADAQRWLERATKSPRVAAAARRELEGVRRMRLQQAKPAAEPAEAAAAEEAQ